MITLIAVHRDQDPFTLHAARTPWSVFQDGSTPTSLPGGLAGGPWWRIPIREQGTSAVARTVNPSPVSCHPRGHPHAPLRNRALAWPSPRRTRTRRSTEGGLVPLPAGPSNGHAWIAPLGWGVARTPGGRARAHPAPARGPLPRGLTPGRPRARGRGFAGHDLTVS